MDIHIGEIPWWLVMLCAAAAGAAGLWRGGRAGAAVGLALSMQFVIDWVTPGVNPSWLAVTEDLVTLAICLALVLTGRNYWTVWAAATQVLSVVTQVLKVVPGLTGWSYYSAQRAWFIVLIASLLLGSLLSSPPARAAPVGGR